MSPTIAPARTRTIPAPAMLRRVDLDGPAGRLEAMLNEGRHDAPFAALVCPPHPRGGGNLHNKVVYSTMKVLNDPEWGLGWPVLRFNFRGTGLSQGTHDGVAETGDVLAALHWLVNEYKRPLVLAGFSFGAAMAVNALPGARCGRPGVQTQIRALIAIGLPTRADGCDFDYPFLAQCAIPKLFLSGDHDQYAPAAQLARVAASAANPKRLLLLPGGDHFFAGQLEPMQQALSGWLKEQLQ